MIKRLLTLFLAFFAVQASAQLITPFSKRYSVNQNGSIVYVSNNIITASGTNSAAARAEVAPSGTSNNNGFTGVYIDIDGDATTFSSSSANLALPACAEVTFAGLYWGGIATSAQTSAQRRTVRLKLPGSSTYTNLTADQVIGEYTASSDIYYSAFKDVTSLINKASASGTYTLANLYASTGTTNRAAGWSIVIVYKDLTQTSKNLTVFDGLANVSTGSTASQSVDIPFSGFLTPPTGSVALELGVIAYEGDRGSTGDNLLFNGNGGTTFLNVNNSLNPSGNFFNSTISRNNVLVTNRNPSDGNTLGYDADIVSPDNSTKAFITNNRSSATIRVNTSSETYTPTVITTAIDSYDPLFTYTTTITDINGGTAVPNDELLFSFSTTNVGNDAALQAIAIDTLPVNVDYVPGSFRILTGANAGTKTESAGDDQMEYDAVNRVIKVRLGTGANATSGGTISNTAGSNTTSFEYRVKITTDCERLLCGNSQISNDADLLFKGNLSGGQGATTTTPPASSGCSTGPTTINMVVPNTCVPPPDFSASGGCSYDMKSASRAGYSYYRSDGTLVADGIATLSGVYFGRKKISSDCTSEIQITVSLTCPPVATNNVATTAEDASTTFSITANDTDSDGTINPATVDLNPSTPAEDKTFTVAGQGTYTVDNAGNLTFTPIADYNGTGTSISYTVKDNAGLLSNVATITVTVTAVNDAPVAVNNTVTTNEDTPISVDVTANDTDIDGTINKATVDLDPSTAGEDKTFTVANQGTYTVNTSGVVTFTPLANFNGSATAINYTVKDNNGLLSNTATFAVTVTAVNDVPTPQDDTYAATEDTPLTIAAGAGLLFNDTDVENDPLTITASTQPGKGSVTVNANGSFTYTPNANYNGPDSFTYTVSDGKGGTATATVNLNVAAVNDAPVAVADSYSIVENGTLNIAAAGVLSNDTDIDGDILTVGAVVTQPLHGTLTQNANGSFKYVPLASYNGTDTYTYRVTDGKGGTSTATVTITVTASNDVPVAQNDTYSGVEDTPLAIPVGAGVLFNDTDIDNDPLTAVIATQPTKGTVILNANGSFTYTPNANTNGTDSFTYTVNDGNGGSATGTVTLNIAAVNDAPVAVNNTASGTEDAVLTVNIATNDTDVDGTINAATIDLNPATPAEDKTFTVAGQGTYTVDNLGVVTFTPVLNFNGTATAISYTIKDNNGAVSNSATLSITLSAVNDAPVAVANTATTDENVVVSFNITANDTDVDGTINSATVDLNPTAAGQQTTLTTAQGTFTVNTSGVVTFTPVTSFNGTASASYTVADNQGAVSNVASLTVTVAAVNDNPVANNDSYSIAEDNTLTVAAAGVLTNDTDIDGDVLSVDVVVSQPVNGTLTQNANGRFVYVPNPNFNGTDSYTYRVIDGKGGSAIGTVNITVTAVNDAPIARNDEFTVSTNTPFSIGAPGVLFNDNNGDGNAETISVTPQTNVVGASGGTFSVTANGAVSYTPATNFNGIESFPYTITDAGGNSASAVAIFDVGAGNDTPISANDAYTTTEDVTLNVPARGVLTNDTDPDDGNNANLSAILVSTTTNGILTLNDNGSFTYIPNNDFFGSDSFTYRATDANGTFSQSTVVITVTAANDAPVSNNDAITTNEDTSATIDVTANDTDVDGTINKASVDLDPNTPAEDKTLTIPGQGTYTVNNLGVVTFVPVLNFNGTATAISYTVKDNNGLIGNRSMIVFTVTSVNDAPVAGNDATNTLEDTQVAVSVIANDTDVDGTVNITTVDLDPATAGIQNSITTAQGTFTVSTNGVVTFVPALNFNGTASVSYTVNDNNGLTSNTATLSISVTSVNDAPSAINDVLAATEDTTITIDLTANDTDVDGTVNRATVDLDPSTPAEDKTFTVPGQGTYTVDNLGVVTFVPAPNFNGPATAVAYTVKDNNGLLSNTATLSVTVAAVNDAPVANADAYSLPEDGSLNVPVALGVLSNDTDVDGEAIVSVLSAPSNGTLDLNADGSFTYTPNANFTGTDTFSYRACDGSGACSVPTTVTLTVTSVNDAPSAINDVLAATEDTTITIDLTANDTDVDGTVNRATVDLDPSTPAEDKAFTVPGQGTYTVDNLGVVTFVPAPNFNGPATAITYTVKDGNGLLSNTATLAVTVAAVNDAPTAAADAYSLPEDGSLNVPVALGVLSNDTDVDGEAIVSVLSSPSNGTLDLNADGSFTYTPNANFTGTDTFSYRACDGSGACSVPTAVTLTVTSVNDAPSAMNDVLAATEDTTATIDLTANDTDVDGTVNRATVDLDPSTPAEDKTFTVPGQGTYTVDNLGVVTFVPAPNFNGPATAVAYTVKDNNGLLSNTATLSVTVGAVNDAPVANADAYTVAEDGVLAINPGAGLLFNDTDTDGDALTATVAAQPAHGTVTVNANGSFAYVPNADFNGSDSFTYTVSDGKGGTATGTVGLTVTAENDVPVAADDAYTVGEDQVLTVAAANGLRANDADADGDALTAVVVVQPANGTVTLNADGSFAYTPNPNFNGTDSYSYRISDGRGGTAVANVGISVGAVNDAPIALNDDYTATEDTPLTIAVGAGLLFNDVDTDRDPLTITASTLPAHGTLTLNPNGSFTYTPNANYNGADSFTYTIGDGQATATGTVNLIVNAVNDIPIANNDNYTVVEDNTLTVPAAGVITNDTDADGDPLFIDGVVAQPTHGTLVLNANGSLTYVPNPNFNGTDTFSYRLDDRKGGSSVATATITVTAINDAPIARTDDFIVMTNTTLNIPGPGVLFNDENGDGDTEAITAVPQSNVVGANGGTFSLSASGAVTYVPAANFNGTESFPYSIRDAAGNTANAIAIFDVGAGNDAPIAVNDSYTTQEDITLTISAKGVLTNDTDPDDGSNINLAAILVSGPTKGTLTLNADGSFVYIPNNDVFGSDSFTYNATDANGATQLATVSINITAVNDAVVALNDAITTQEDTSVSIDIVANDADVDGTVNKATVDLDPTTPVEDKTFTVANQGTYTVNINGVVNFVPFANFNGAATAINYTVKDNNGLLSNIAMLAITVTAVNDAPITNPDLYTLTEDGVLNVPSATGLLANDSDADSEANVSILTLSTNGSISLNSDGSFIYTPNPNFSGTDTFTYQACDGAGGCSAITTVTINVTAVNDDPVGNDDSYTTAEDVSLTIDAPGVLLNDTDGDNDVLSVEGISVQPLHGVVTLSANGKMVYVPNLNYNGLDQFTYTVKDANGAVGTAMVSITVLGVNDAPIVVADQYTATEDTPLIITGANGLLGNDTDPDNDPISASITTQPAHGTVVVNTDGSFTYTPAANYNGPDSFTYTATDGKGGFSTSTANITVNSVNDIPVAVADIYTIAEDQTLTISAAGVLSNDTDADGNLLVVDILVSDPLNGTVNLNANGSFVYTPNANFTGSDSFSYRVEDGKGGSAVATVTVNVTQVNDNPSLQNDSYTATEDTPLVISAALGLLFNDIDVDNDALVATIAAQPSHGTVTIGADGSFVYTPNANYNGPDSFTYTVSDGKGGSATATVNLAVTAINDAPRAVADIYSVAEDNTLTIPAAGVLANDTDVDGDNLVVDAVTTQPVHGTLTLSANGRLVYIPVKDFSGTDSFEYRVDDGKGGVATTTVTINVTDVNDAPTPQNDTYTATEDVPLVVNAGHGLLFNDTDPDNDPLTVSIAVPPVNGTVTLNTNGSFTYVPNANFNGSDSFTYTVSDGKGGTTNAVANIAVSAVNDVPVAVADNYTILEDHTLSINAPGVLANDTDVDGDALTVDAVVSQPLNGTVTLAPNGRLIYIPNANFNGTDQFNYRVDDGKGGSSVATVSINVTSENDVPTPQDDIYFATEDIPLVVAAGPGLLFNDTDTDQNPLTASVATQPSHGTVVVNADGSFTYTPNANYNGLDSFTYRVSDGQGGTALATVNLTVNAVNDIPVAVNDSYTVAEDLTLTVPARGVLINDTDLDGDLLTVDGVVSQPLHGTLTLTATGLVTYVPDANYNGTDSFTYRVDDGKGGFAIATVNLTVTPVNDIPIARNDKFFIATNTTLNPSNLNIASPGVLFNDTNGDGDNEVLNVTPQVNVSTPNGGIFNLAADGRITYTPALNFNGTESFNYTITDAGGNSATATIEIEVGAGNDAPIPVDDSYTTQEDVTLVVPTKGVLTNDVDPDDGTNNSLAAILVSGPTNGILTLNADGSFTYVPNNDFVGTDSFIYNATDANGLAVAATVTLTITSVNDAPSAINDVLVAAEDTTITIDLTANDTDVDGTVNRATVDLDPSTPAEDKAFTVPGQGTYTVDNLGVVTFVPAPNFNGPATAITYTVKDGNGLLSNTATLAVTVAAVNDAPVANADAYSLPEDGSLNVPVALGVLSNDTDVDGEAIVSVLSAPSNGTLDLNADGSFTYTPNANFTGTDTFSYRACDGSGACSVPTAVTLTVTSVNDAPSAINDVLAATEDTTITIDLTANDTDVDGTVNRATVDLDPSTPAEDKAFTVPGQGTYTVDNLGVVTFVPAPNFNGPATAVAYTVKDNNGLLSNTATLSVTVAAVNDAPVANADAYSLPEDGSLNVPVALGVLSNDTDVDGEAIVSVLSAPSNGTLDLNADGSFTYTPNANFTGTDTFSYRACDGSGACSVPTTVTLTVTSVNDAPSAINDVLAATEDTTITIDLTANDTDVDGTVNRATVDLDPSTPAEDKAFTVPGQGTYTVDNLGVVTFVPAPNFNGPATAITYTVKDGNGLLSNTATLAVTVAAVNDAPTAAADAYSLPEDGSLNVPVALGVLSNDTDVDGEAIVSVLSAPSNGTLDLNADGSFTYTPNANFTGTDTFSYRACDGSGACSVPVTVTLTVTSVNDAPSAMNDVLAATEDTTATIDLTANDTDVDGTVNRATVDLDPSTPAEDKTFTVPGQGTYTVDNLGVVTFVPAPNFNGPATAVTYTVKDGNGLLSNTTTLAVTVAAVNDAPTAAADAYSLAEDGVLAINPGAGLLFNDTDTDGDALTATVAAQPAHGTVTVNANGSFAYVPNADFNGSDSFTYTVSDGKGGTATGTVGLTVTAENDVPVAADDAYTVGEDQVLTVAAANGLRANDADADGDALTAVVVVQPANGTVVLNADGSFAYTPNPNFNGTDSYSYRISDGRGGTAVANVGISVGAVNDAPIALNDQFSVATNTTLTIAGPGVLFNDSNGDGDNELISVIPQVVTGTGGGQLTLNADGSLTYIPFPNTNYIESFTYTVQDGAGNKATATAKFDVGDGNDAPIAINDSYSIAEDNTLTIAAKGVLSNDTDPDDGNNSNLAAILATAPLHGTLILDANGSFVYVPNNDFFGSDSFTYYATDANGAKNLATVTITVTAVNDVLVALNDTEDTNEDTSVSIDVTLNDTDIDGSVNKATVDLNPSTPVEDKTITVPNQGTYTVNNAGIITFVPALNFNGTATPITYTIKDNQGLLSNTATLTIKVNPINDAPVSVAEGYTVAEDGILNVPAATGVLANDNDVDGEAIVSVLNTASNGVLKLNTDGSFSYTPNADFTGTDSFTYQACDGNGGCSIPTTVTITVSAVNDAPLALTDNYTATEDVTLTIAAATGVLLNDSDTENSALAVTVATPPTNGTLTLNANGSFTYIPNTNFNGTDRFTYTLSDAQGGTATGIVNLVVDAVNDAPIAQNNTYSVVEDNILTVPATGVLNNDTDVDNDLLVVNSVITPPAHGTVTLNANGSFVYIPNANYNGIDSYTYRIDDGNGGSATATVNLTITAQNDRPSPQDDNYNAIEDQPLIISAANGVSFNDTDTDEDALSVSVLAQPTKGTLVLATNGSFTYTPNANYNGADQFTYTVTDANGASSSATVTIQVAPVNDLPSGTVDTYSTSEDVPLVIAAPGVLANDTDVDGDLLSIERVVAQPLHGTLTLDLDGRFRYVPDANYNGTDSFTYLLNDHNGGTTNVVVNLTVTPVNDRPQPQDDNYVATEDTPLVIAAGAGLLFNDEDAEQNVLTATVGSQPANGTVVVNANGSFTYTPSVNYNGPDSFTYTVSDGNGGSATATVNLLVLPVNDAPVAVNDSYSIAEDSILTIQAPGVLSNDTDVDGDVLVTNGIVTQPANGEVILNANGRFVYIPNMNFNGNDSFTYMVDDHRGGTAIATVNITVTAVNDDPIARDDEFIVTTNVTLNITGKGVLFNDSNGDEAGNPETITATPQSAVIGSKGGTLTLNANGSLTYVPAPNLSYVETFSYSITDAAGNAATANAVFVVGAGNDAPIAANDSYSTPEDVNLIIPAFGVLVNDTDPDNGSYTGLASILVTGTTNGKLTLNEDGSFMYVPNNNFVGTDSFTYNSTDANGATSTATVTITVSPLNDAPVAVNNIVTTNEDTAVAINILANDSDVDGTLDAATIDLNPETAALEQTLTVPGEGTYVVTGTTVTFTPVANFNGLATAISYTVKDNNGLVSNTATISVTITPVNDAPIAQVDTYTVAEDGALNINAVNGVLKNDADLDGEAIVSVLGATTNGTLDLNRDGSFTYVPNANFSGTDSFTYQACDANGACSVPTTVTITVSPVNDAPVAVNNIATTNEDTAVAINILANDSDVDGTLDAATIDLDPETAAIEQTLTIAGEGTYVVSGTTVTFTPVANFNGPATAISYTVKDNNGLVSNIATISVTVASVNDAPVAQGDTYTIEEDGTLTISTSNGVLKNDVDLDGEAIVSVLGATTNGTLDLNRDGSFTYVPNANFSGTDSFTYQACDANGACSVPTTVTITVSPVNDAPVAVNNIATTNEDTAVAINILANDSDVDGTLDATTIDLDPETAAIEQTLTIAGEGTYVVTGTTVTFTPVLNFNGPTTVISYTVKDNNGLVSNTATISVIVTPVNDAPVAQADAYTTNEDVPLNIDAPGVEFNDSDPENNPLASVVATPPTNGTLQLNRGGGFLYTPNANFNGSDSFTYTISDGQGGVSTATVNITVLPTNDMPDAQDDATTTTEDTPVSLVVTANDTDKDGTINIASVDLDPFTEGIQTSIVNAQGTWVVDATGKVTFSPAANFNGIATKIYTVNDNDGETSVAATITVTVTSVNDAPVANNDVTTTQEDISVTFSVVSNDTDADGTIAQQTIDLDPLTAGIQSTLTTSDGTWKTDALGNVIFDPTANFNGMAVVSYTVLDNDGLVSNVAQLTVSISDINDVPVAVNDQITINEDNVAVITVLTNDFDTDGTIILSSVDLDPTVPGIQKTLTNAQGTWTASQTGRVTFVPAANFNGLASINYVVLDDTGTASNVAVIAVTVTDQNDAPLALDDFANTAGTAAITFNVIGNDTDVDGTVTITSVDLDPTVNGIQKTLVTSQGTWTADNLGNVTFTANANFVGAASLTYTVSDNDGALSNVANLTVNVSSVNNAPIAVNDTFTTNANTPLAASVFANDTDPDGNGFTATVITQPANGTLSLNANGSFSYVPNTGFIGSDSFTYRICDNGAPSLCSQPATVSINVIANNIAPIAIADIASTSENTAVNGNVLTNDSDPDGNALTASIVTQPTNGTVVLNANGTYQYTPRNGFSGSDSFTYRVCDNGTPSLCSQPATVTITVIANNIAPIATADVASTIENSPVSGNVLTNDSDPDGNALTVSISTQPANGVVVLNANGTYQYTPRNGFSGSDSFSYRVCDNGTPSLCATATVTITVTPLPRPVIGIAKVAGQVKRMLNGSYNITYIIQVRNYGAVALTNVQVEDNLRQAFPVPATISLVGAPIATGGLVANTDYNGTTVTALLRSNSTLPVGASETIEITVNVLTDNVSKTYFNSATATAIGNTFATTDVSVDGVNPDPDNNQIPNENSPTPVTLKETSVFIPKGFSPNGDGVNDRFIIENAGNERIHLEVYNRWGNLVFKNTNYQNEWEGYTNTGIRLGETLPDGTYYYIVYIGKQKYVSYLTINR